jgi:hypothetical protein
LIFFVFFVFFVDPFFAWRHEAESRLAAFSRMSPEVPAVPDQFLILVTCRDEQHQTEMLARLSKEGVECKALLAQAS